MAEHVCDHPWCIAAVAADAMCDCPFAQMYPHRRVDCTRRDREPVPQSGRMRGHMRYRHEQNSARR